MSIASVIAQVRSGCHHGAVIPVNVQGFLGKEGWKGGAKQELDHLLGLVDVVAIIDASGHMECTESRLAQEGSSTSIFLTPGQQHVGKHECWGWVFPYSLKVKAE